MQSALSSPCLQRVRGKRIHTRLCLSVAELSSPLPALDVYYLIILSIAFQSFVFIEVVRIAIPLPGCVFWLKLCRQSNRSSCNCEKPLGLEADGPTRFESASQTVWCRDTLLRLLARHPTPTPFLHTHTHTHTHHSRICNTFKWLTPRPIFIQNHSVGDCSVKYIIIYLL